MRDSERVPAQRKPENRESGTGAPSADDWDEISSPFLDLVGTDETSDDGDGTRDVEVYRDDEDPEFDEGLPADKPTTTPAAPRNRAALDLALPPGRSEQLTPASRANARASRATPAPSPARLTRRNQSALPAAPSQTPPSTPRPVSDRPASTRPTSDRPASDRPASERRASERRARPARMVEPEKIKRGKEKDREAAVELAISEIAGHLTFTPNTVTAWYWLPEVRWSFRPDAEREALIVSIAEQFSGLAGFRLHLRRTTRPFAADDWARTIDKLTASPLPTVPGAPSWSDHLVAAQRHLQAVDHAEGQTYLGVTFARRSLGSPCPSASPPSSAREFRRRNDAAWLATSSSSTRCSAVLACGGGGPRHRSWSGCSTARSRSEWRLRRCRRSQMASGNAVTCWPSPSRSSDIALRTGRPSNSSTALLARSATSPFWPSAVWSRWRSPNATSRGFISTSACRGRWRPRRASTSSGLETRSAISNIGCG